MARSKNNNVQINISIPSEWKTELENLARFVQDVFTAKTVLCKMRCIMVKRIFCVNGRSYN